jgi:RNA polymerase sigma factor (sigma-70 family)
MTDTQLLIAYSTTASQDAFAELARRYINLVYAAALRQTRDRHLADDVTQAVFIVLAQKAGTIRDAATLPAWLINTTRYAALNLNKFESRRKLHEQRAAAMLPTSSLPAEPFPDIAPLLDQSLASLSTQDRSALVLRYLQGKSLREVSEAQSITEEAARKRVTRALAKLRTLFSRAGIRTPADALESALAQQSLAIAPAALLPLVVQQSLSAAIAVSAPVGSTLLAKATLKTMTWLHAKLFATTALASIVIAAAATTAVVKSPLFAAAENPPVAAPATTAPAATFTFPMQFANIVFKSNESSDQYICGLDPATTRTPNTPVNHIRSNSPAAKQGHQFFWAPVAPLRGHRIRISAWMKSQDVDRFAGLFVNVWGENQRVFGHDGMYNRTIKGTTGWTERSIVVDIPPETQTIQFGSHLDGTGELWTDDVRIDIVGDDVPTTDDQNWNLETYFPKDAKTAAAPDPATPRNGHPTTQLSQKTSNISNFVSYSRYDRRIGPYVGKRMRLTAWVKTDIAQGAARFTCTFQAAGYRSIPYPVLHGEVPLRGVTDWHKIELIADVPPDAQSARPNFDLYGNAKLWIDDLQTEFVDAPALPVSPVAVTAVAPTPKPTDPPSEAPAAVLIENDTFAGFTSDRSSAAIDPDVRRLPNSAPALRLASTEKPTVPTHYFRTIDSAPFRNQRVRITAWMKTENLANFAGLLFNANTTTIHSCAADWMPNRPLTKTTDWTLLQIVSDIPPETTGISLGVNLFGAGKIWLDDMRIEIVSPQTPTTDDSHNYFNAPLASQFTATLDPAVKRNGHPTLRVGSIPHADLPPGSWSFYGDFNRHPEKFIGKTVRLSAWIKSENVTGGVGARLAVWATDRIMKNTAVDSPATRKLIKGTTDWTFYETTATIPAGTQRFDAGFNFNARGTIWVDELKIELVNDADSNL